MYSSRQSGSSQANRQSLTDVIGPVMIGPSSSHTAGAVRLGLMARLIACSTRIESSPSWAEWGCVRLQLFNSFAQTFRGHGTDKGLIAGLLGFSVDDERIREAPDWAAKAGLGVALIPETGANPYAPNTVIFGFDFNGQAPPLNIVGHSIGAGAILISQINDLHVSLKGQMPTLLMTYCDKPGMIWQVTKFISETGQNIATLNCTRQAPGAEAFMSITLDQPLTPETVQAIRDIDGVYTARHIPALRR